ncbi:MAG: 23S rRNA (uracil(1939)-C(5))-methyltransferase RlmD [Bacteroidales bacterium]|jgi:23S rRNA (uracil1939-C5)-methyltransferase|nr:23S rRNA (uracil(1939)-C(5))-methyltransferase RlmD [Bacteroidales bacterium]
MKLNKVRTKEILEKVEITEAVAEGKAMARVEDRVIFVPFVVPGDIVDILIKKKKKNFAEGEAIAFHQYSDFRIDAHCPHFGFCGGCKWQTLRYDKQLFFKNKQVLDNLQRIGKIDCNNALPIIGSEEQFFYRNKLEFTFSSKQWLTKLTEDIKKNEEGALGFHIPNFFDKVLEITDCALQKEPSNEIRNFIRSYVTEKKLPFYDIRNHNGLMRNLIIRTSTTNDLMLIVVFAENSPEIEPLLQTVANQFPQISSLLYVINTKFNDTIGDQNIICFKGKDFIMEQMPMFHNENQMLNFKIRGKSFYQTNSKQAYQLYKIAAETANLTKESIVYDLYTGCGTIANFIAGSVKKVIGIEYVDEAIIDARENSKENGILNTTFFAGDMSKVLTDEFVSINGKPDIIITDPPRAGMHPDVLTQLLKTAAKKIVYISCNPATQARDINTLLDKYTVGKIQPVDMFPHTHHVENVVELNLK